MDIIETIDLQINNKSVILVIQNTKQALIPFFAFFICYPNIKRDTDHQQ